MTLDNDDAYKKLIRHIDVDLKKMKKHEDIYKTLIAHNKKSIQVLYKHVENEKKRISESKKNLLTRLEENNNTIKEYKEKLPQLRNSSLSKKRQEKKVELKSLQESNQKLSEEREKLKAAIKRKREEITESQATTKKQRQLEVAELKACVEATQFEITNTEDTINISFKCIDEKKPDDVYTCALLLNESGYSVLKCPTKIRDLQEIIDMLNTTRDFYKFLKTFRRKLKESVA